MLLNERGHRDGADVVKVDAAIVAPIEKAGDCPGIGPSRIRIPNVGRKELKEPLACLIPGLSHESGEQYPVAGLCAARNASGRRTLR
jgi:hypothetical protein